MFRTRFPIATSGFTSAGGFGRYSAASKATSPALPLAISCNSVRFCSSKPTNSLESSHPGPGVVVAGDVSSYAPFWKNWTDPIFQNQPIPAATGNATATKKPTTNELVAENWATVKAAFSLEQVGELFYKNLFGMAPDLKATVFGNTDHTMQPKALMSFIDLGISLLDQPDKLVPALVQCGERHAAYGKDGHWCEEAHYPVVGKALMMTLEQGLGDKLTAEHKAAWGEVYGVIQAKMIEGQTSAKGKAIRAKAEAKLAKKE